MRIGHFFDIDTLIQVNSKVWIVSKTNPNKPLLKIDQSEYNLIKNGIYRKFDKSLYINGVKYWLTEDILDKIKLKCKLNNLDISKLSFSLQEYNNKDIIDNLEYKILSHNFKHLKNKTDDIIVMCSKNNKQNYETIIKKLEDTLLKEGLKIKKYYYISETFLHRDKDDIAYKKIRLFLQHLIGLKTDGDKFTDIILTKYDIIYYYDEDINSLSKAINVNSILSGFLDRSEDPVKLNIKKILNNGDTKLVVREITNNKMNIFNEKSINIKYNYVVRTFESFSRK
jgi:hypothetical protein